MSGVCEMKAVETRGGVVAGPPDVAAVGPGGALAGGRVAADVGASVGGAAGCRRAHHRLHACR